MNIIVTDQYDELADKVKKERDFCKEYPSLKNYWHFKKIVRELIELYLESDIKYDPDNEAPYNKKYRRLKQLHGDIERVALAFDRANKIPGPYVYSIIREVPHKAPQRLH